MTKALKLNLFAYALSVSVVALSIYVWGETYSWRFANMNPLKLFPLFGLIAFTLMWSHYIVGAVRMYFGVDSSETKKYFEITAWVVLASLLLHPGLLSWQLWRNGEGLPPMSVINAVPDNLQIAVIMGSIAFVIFMLFELRHFFGDRKWWKYIEQLNFLAMIIVFIHAIRLGGALNGWFLIVWYWYGISLVMAVAYSQFAGRKIPAQELEKSVKKHTKKAPKTDKLDKLA